MLDFLETDSSGSSWTECLLFWGTGVGSMLYLRPVLTIFDIGAGGKLSLRTGYREDGVRRRCVGESCGGCRDGIGGIGVLTCFEPERLPRLAALLEVGRIYPGVCGELYTVARFAIVLLRGSGGATGCMRPRVSILTVVSRCV